MSAWSILIICFTVVWIVSIITNGIVDAKKAKYANKRFTDVALKFDGEPLKDDLSK